MASWTPKNSRENRVNIAIENAPISPKMREFPPKYVTERHEMLTAACVNWACSLAPLQYNTFREDIKATAISLSLILPGAFAGCLRVTVAWVNFEAMNYDIKRHYTTCLQCPQSAIRPCYWLFPHMTITQPIIARVSNELSNTLPPISRCADNKKSRYFW